VPDSPGGRPSAARSVPPRANPARILPLPYILLLVLAGAVSAQDKTPTGTPVPTAGRETLEAARQRVAAFNGTEPAPVRVAWIRELGRFADAQAARLLLNLLATEKLPAVRTEVVRALGRQRGAEVTTALVRELETADLGHREAAIAAVASQGEAGAGTLIGHLRNAKAPREREQFLRGVAASGAEAARPVVHEYLDQGTPLEKLAVLESLREVEPWPELVARKRACLTDSYQALKAEALHQLGVAKDPQAKALALTLVKASDRRVRGAVTATLGVKLLPAEAPTWAEAAAIDGGDLLPEAEEAFPRIRQDAAVWRWFLERGLVARDKNVRLLSLRVIAPIPGDEITRALVAQAQGDDPPLYAAALAALQQRGDPGAMAALEGLIQKGGPAERKALVLEALSAFKADDPAWLRLLTDLVTTAAPEIRVGAVQALTTLRNEAAAPAVHTVLNHPSWTVRAAAVRFCARVRTLANIPALFPRVDAEEGRLKQEVIDALDAHTGLTFTDSARWDAWWKTAAATFKLRPEFDLKAGEPRAGATTAATWFTIPLYSRRVVFCMDTSGSMDRPIGTGGTTRIAEARRELAEVLRRSDPQVQFNVILFDSAPHPWKQRLVTASKEDKEAAIRFAEETTPQGGTDIHGALEAACKDPKVDTVYLLSDGDPSAGRIRNPEILAAEVLRWCKARSLVIHTVAVGGESPLLRKLAEQVGGTCVVRL
jgi:HEAT repeat protein